MTKAIMLIDPSNPVFYFLYIVFLWCKITPLGPYGKCGRTPPSWTEKVLLGIPNAFWNWKGNGISWEYAELLSLQFAIYN